MDHARHQGCIQQDGEDVKRPAGNLWAVNNWKPQIDFDILNPGGDGICIFVGLAKPPVRDN